MRLRPRQNQIQRRQGLIPICHTLGEVTSDIAEAIPAARATKVLPPINCGRLEIAGSENQTLDRLIRRSLTRVTSLVVAPTPCDHMNNNRQATRVCPA
jgi:Domain of unknown function (DUF3842)